MFGKDRSKNNAQAIAEARRAVQADPSDIRALHKLGDLYNRSDQTKKALETYLEVASRYAEEEAHSKAIAVYKQALKLAPQNPTIYRGIGGSCAASKRTNEAQEAYQTASQIFERSGHLGSALDAIQEALDRLEPNSTLWARLGTLHAARKEEDEAVSAYEEALQLAESAQKWNDCLVLSEQLLNISPQHLGAFRLASFAALERKDTMRALGFLRRAFRVHREDEVILEMMADAFALIGQTQKTITLLHELAKKYEESDKEVAREYYERVLTYDPNHAETKKAIFLLADVGADWGAAEELEWDVEIEIEGQNAMMPTDDTYESVPSINFLQSASQFDTSMFPDASQAEPETQDFAELFSQAETCFKYELFDRTAELLQQILTQAPTHVEARQLHAHLLARQGSPEEAASIWFSLANETKDPITAQLYLRELLSIDGVSRDFRSLASNMLRQYQFTPHPPTHSV